jgi:hypothetical protein
LPYTIYNPKFAEHLQKANNIQLTGIILAGGKGIRLGHNKGMTRLRSRYLDEKDQG